MSPDQIEGQTLGHVLAVLVMLAVFCTWIAVEWRLSRPYRVTRESIRRAKADMYAERRIAERQTNSLIRDDGRFVKSSAIRRVH